MQKTFIKSCFSSDSAFTLKIHSFIKIPEMGSTPCYDSWGHMCFYSVAEPSLCWFNSYVGTGIAVCGVTMFVFFLTWGNIVGYVGGLSDLYQKYAVHGW